MKLSSVVKALGSLCLLFADGLPVFKVGPPEIIMPEKVKLKAQQGEHLVLGCKAFTHSEDGMTLIYWLVNGSFPEDMSSSDRIEESEESTLEGGAVVQRTLLLKNVTSEDLKSTFTCVVTTSVGMTQKHIKLVNASGGGKEKERRGRNRPLGKKN